jgi:hypothetical protein
VRARIKTMYPNIFITKEQKTKNDRMYDAIHAELTIGGKFFCWHDYTFFNNCIREHIHDWGYLYKCVKCGKNKVFKYHQLERVEH